MTTPQQQPLGRPVCPAVKGEQCTQLAGHVGMHVGSHGRPWSEVKR